MVEIPADVMHADREPIHDVARNLERWVDAVVIRTFSQDRLVQIGASTTRLHVINALSDEQHPCQALADVPDIVRVCGARSSGRTIAFVGDGNNVATSMVHAASMLGMSVRVATPKGYELPEHRPSSRRRALPPTAPNSCSSPTPRRRSRAPMPSTPTSGRRWARRSKYAERKNIFARYQVNEALMARAKPQALFMHCLPAHRGEEVTDEVIESSASVVFDQAENRLHAQKALMLMLIGGASSNTCSAR